MEERRPAYLSDKPEKKVLGYYTHIGSSGRVIAHVGFDDNGDYMMNGIFDTDRAYSVRKVDVQVKYQKVEGFDPNTLERQTCPRRVDSHGPWSNSQNTDYWEGRGDHKCCSFCGSHKFEVLQEIVEKTIAGVEGYGVEHSTKDYKIYMEKPGDSHMKFYTYHVPKMEEEELRVFSEKFMKAKRISHEKHMAKLEAWKRSLQTTNAPVQNYKNEESGSSGRINEGYDPSLRGSSGYPGGYSTCGSSAIEERFGTSGATGTSGREGLIGESGTCGV